MSSYVDDVIAKEASVQSLGPSPEQEEEGASIALRVPSLTLSSLPRHVEYLPKARGLSSILPRGLHDGRQT